MKTIVRVGTPWLLALSLCSPASLLAQPRLPAGNTLAEFDVAKDGDALLLPVRFHGKTYLFLLDTGASHTVYDVSLKPLLGQPAEVERVAVPTGETTVQSFPAPDAHLGPLNLRGRSVVLTADLSQWRQITGKQIYGVVGLNFLERYVVQVDFDRGRVAFLRRVPPDAGTPVALVRDESCWFIQARLGTADASERFMVDTGDVGLPAINVTPFRLEKLVRSGKARPDGSTLFSDVANTQVRRQYRLPLMRVGTFEHRQLLMEASQDNALGLGYWSRYVVTFDFPHRQVFLKKGQRYAAVDMPDRSGLHVVRVDGKTVIAVVDKGRAGDRSGIRTKDVLVKMDGLDVSHLSMFQLRQQLSQPGKKMSLALCRDGHAFNVVLSLEQDSLTGRSQK